MKRIAAAAAAVIALGGGLFLVPRDTPGIDVLR